MPKVPSIDTVGFVHSHKLGERAGALVFVMTTWHLAPTAQKVGHTRVLPSDRESETHCFCLMPIQQPPAPSRGPGPAPPQGSSPSRCSVVTRPSATMKAIF